MQTENGNKSTAKKKATYRLTELIRQIKYKAQLLPNNSTQLCTQNLWLPVSPFKSIFFFNE